MSKDKVSIKSLIKEYEKAKNIQWLNYNMTSADWINFVEWIIDTYNVDKEPEKRTVFKCPRCFSGNIAQYRMLTGKIWCDDCGYEILHKEQHNPFIKEIITDKEPDNCEYKGGDYSDYRSKCGLIDFNNIHDFKYCPYCGKPIKIKGE